MVVGEIAVDLCKQDMVFPRQPCDELLQGRAGRAVPCIPANAEAGKGRLIDPLQCLHQPVDIIVQNGQIGDFTRSVVPVPGSCHRAQILNILSEKRSALKNHFEAVVIGRIVAARYLYAAIHFLAGGLRVIQHRGGAHADGHYIAPTCGQAFDQRAFQNGRADPAIIADRHCPPACAHHHRAETTADCAGIVCLQRFADNAANIIFAQNGRIERMAHFRGLSSGNSSRRRSRAAVAS